MHNISLNLTMKLKLVLVLALTLIGTVTAWDNEELEIFDVVEEVNQNFYEMLGVKQVRQVKGSLIFVSSNDLKLFHFFFLGLFTNRN